MPTRQELLKQGAKYHAQKEYTKAFPFLQQAAEKGCEIALYNLGLMYFHGQGVPQDYQKARECFEKAIEKGCEIALNNLGALYMDGLGVPQDYQKARDYFEKAAAKKHSFGFLNLAKLYERGLGVTKDYQKAKEIYEKAIGKGFNSFLVFIGFLYQKGYGSLVQDYGKAREYYEKGLEKRYFLCFYFIGLLYEKGYGVVRDYQKAREYYEKAAEKNDQYGLIGLGWLYEGGLGVAQDYRKAREYYEQTGVLSLLGQLYENGHGVAQNYDKALECYKSAVENSQSLPVDSMVVGALFGLGRLYENGYGVIQDYTKAKEYYEQASAKASLFASLASSIEICGIGLSYYDQIVGKTSQLVKELKVKLDNKESLVLAKYFEFIENPDQLTFLKLNEVFSLVTHVTEFKFPYTLANISREIKCYPEAEINHLIFETLQKLADHHINSEGEAVAFKLILDSVRRKQVISKEQQYLLDRKAEKTDTFADKRFVDLKTRVSLLERQVAHLHEITYQHSNQIRQIAGSVSDLKKAMQKRAKRQTYCSIAKMALCFAGPLVDIFANVADLSDFAEIGSVVLNVDVSTLQSASSNFAKQVDVEKLKEEFVGHAAEKTLEKIGLSPDEYIEIWTKTTITLKTEEAAVKKESSEIKSPQQAQLSQASSSASFFSGAAPASVSSIDASSELKAYIEKLAKAGYVFTISQQSNLRQIDIECIKMNMQDPELDDHPQRFMQLLQNNMTQAGAHVEMQHIQEEDKLVIQGARGAIKNAMQLLENAAAAHLATTSNGKQCVLL